MRNAQTMPNTETLGNFIDENKKLIRDYFETRLEIYRLRTIKSVTGIAGHFLWIIVLLFLLSLLIIFLGIVTGFWLSEKMGSYTGGFGLTALLVLVLVLLVVALRKFLFINPLIRVFLKKTNKKGEENVMNDEKQWYEK